MWSCLAAPAGFRQAARGSFRRITRPTAPTTMSTAPAEQTIFRDGSEPGWKWTQPFFQEKLHKTCHARVHSSSEKDRTGSVKL